MASVPLHPHSTVSPCLSVSLEWAVNVHLVCTLAFIHERWPNGPWTCCLELQPPHESITSLNQSLRQPRIVNTEW